MNVGSDIGQFAIVPRWVVQTLADNGDATPVHLYIELALIADRNNGNEWRCSRAMLAEKVGKSPATIDRWTKALVKIGALRVAANWLPDGNQGWNTYTVVAAKPGGGLDAQMSRGTPMGEGGSPHTRVPSTHNQKVHNQALIDAEASDVCEEDLKHPDDGQPSLLQSEENPTTAKPDDGFDAWYATYPRKADPNRTRRYWQNLSRADRSAFLAKLPEWLERFARIEKQFIPESTAFVNGKWRNDVVIPPVPGKAVTRPVGGRVSQSAGESKLEQMQRVAQRFQTQPDTTIEITDRKALA